MGRAMLSRLVRGNSATMEPKTKKQEWENMFAPKSHTDLGIILAKR